MSSIVTTGAVQTLNGVRSVRFDTDGSVGAQEETRQEAERAFGGPAYLSHRASQWGGLSFYWTDVLL